MSAIFFAFISYLGWGTGDIFATIAARKIGGYSATFWYLVFQLLLSLPLALLFIKSLPDFKLEIIIFNLFLGIIGTIGLIAFYEGLRTANASLVGTITSSFVIITVILSTIFLKEHINFLQAIAIVVIFIGVVLSSLNLEELNTKNIKLGKGIIAAFIAMLTFGIYWTFIKIPIKNFGWYWPSMISLMSFPVVLVFMKLKSIKLEKPSYNNAFLPLVANAILLGIGLFSFNHAIEKGLTAVVAPIAGSYPTLFAVLAFLIFRDPITRQQILGIITTLAGIVLLLIFSV